MVLAIISILSLPDLLLTYSDLLLYFQLLGPLTRHRTYLLYSFIQKKRAGCFIDASRWSLSLGGTISFFSLWNRRDIYFITMHAV